jgi:hypothetical protein
MRRSRAWARLGFAILTAAIPLMPSRAQAQDAAAMADRIAAGIAADNALVRELRLEGVKHDTPRAVVWVEKDALTQDEIAGFAALATQAIDGIERVLDITFDKTFFKADRIEYFVSGKSGISHAHRDGLQPAVFITPDRIRNKRAPYIHETTHTMVRWKEHPPWLQEGLPTFVQQVAAARVGGYDWSPGNPDGKDVDVLAKDMVDSEFGARALPLIGHPALARSMDDATAAQFRAVLQDRTAGAPAFYIMSASFVKYLANKAGVHTLVALCKSENLSDTMRGTGKTIDEWKAAWVLSLRAAPR